MTKHRSLSALFAFALAHCAPVAPLPGDASPLDVAQSDAALPSNVTWSEHVAPIVFEHCASCHRAGGIAPFSLSSYQAARPMAAAMAASSAARTMPPTLVDNSGACNTYDHQTTDWLSNDEVATLAAWAQQGAPEGDPARTPALPPPPMGLANVSARIEMSAPFLPDATRMDEIRCFVVDAPSATDQFVTGYSVEPGDPRVVHHVILYALDSEAGVATVTAEDARDARAGYDCPGGAMAPAYPAVLWAPGGPPTALPSGTGLRIAGGRKLVLQVHYNMQQGAFEDRTRVLLQLAPRVEREGRMVAIAASNLRLPPRMTDVVAQGSRAIPANLGRSRLWGVAPHMHSLGTDMQLSLRSSSRCAMDLHHWNFHWQRLFLYSAPLDLNAGETLDVRCHFDTSSKNEVTTWGEGTTDEMCIVYGYVTGA
jgi:hypothetical protein